MTQDEIIRMAREAGLTQYGFLPDIMERFERFAALVAEATKEKAAKVCEEKADSYGAIKDEWGNQQHITANLCAAAIRSME